MNILISGWRWARTRAGVGGDAEPEVRQVDRSAREMPALRRLRPAPSFDIERQRSM